MFVTFAQNLSDHFDQMVHSGMLYKTDVTKDELWETYLNSFPEGLNPIYRERTEHDCSCCRQFISQVGNLVTIKDGQVTTIWGFKTAAHDYQPVADAMDKLVRERDITSVFFTGQKNFGTQTNYEYVCDAHTGSVTKIPHHHFFATMPQTVLRKGTSINECISQANTGKEVFQRALDEITDEAVGIVLDLIETNTLYRGKENQQVISMFRRMLGAYSQLKTQRELDLFAWEKAPSLSQTISHIRNTSIGTLLVNLSKGMDVEQAVRVYESMVAPENYRRPKPVYTERMLENARKDIEAMGYMDSLPRRYANINDITVDNLLFVDREVSKHTFGVGEANGFFDEMKKSIPVVNPKKFSRVEEIGIDKFITSVIPNAKSIEVLLETRLKKNLVSLMAPKNSQSKPMFRWSNRFSWAYSGNLADSSLKANVEKAGGNVHGDLRFSIQWSDDMNATDNNDLDAHCFYPVQGTNHGCYRHIYFGAKIGYNGANRIGKLDIDVTRPEDQMKPAVENIIFMDATIMRPGEYQFFVHCYDYRGGKSGFKAEIECNNEIRSYRYPAPMKQDQKVTVATVELTKDGTFKINDALPSTQDISSVHVWGLDTNQWCPVSVIMHSPNFWNGESGIGAKHTFFMLKDCVNDESPNPFFNEFLNDDFKAHKHIMEALGAKAQVEDAEHQLSGVGFSHTQHNNVFVKVKGATDRVFNIKF